MESSHNITSVAEELKNNFAKLDALVINSSLTEQQKIACIKTGEEIKKAISEQDETRLFEALNQYKKDATN